MSDAAGRVDGTFEGYRAGGGATTLPSQFFVDVLPAIEDEAELRVTLYAMYATARLRGELRAVRASALEAAPRLVRALERWGGAAAVRPALEAAARRGTLLECQLEDGDALYWTHNQGGRRQCARVRAGSLDVPPLPAGATKAHERTVRAVIAEAPGATRAAQAYEQEIGLLTPAVASALAFALERYPEAWVVEAIRLAAQANARSWRYAEAILRRWEAEGRDHGVAGETAGAAGARAALDTPEDPYRRFIRNR